ncbi:MAG: 2Fe-2S iron-sulfur cluster-binding protein [Paralcaligenes sp.]
MIKIILHRKGQVYEGEVKENTNLVVQAGIRQFPHPNLAYRCGMGKCATCTCRVLAGAGHLPAPNWKERKQLGKLLDEGYRLTCQLWLTHDIELTQDIEPVHPQDEGTVGTLQVAIGERG